MQMNIANVLNTAPPPPPLTQPAPKQIAYVPLAREAKARADDTAKTAFRLEAPYTEYGSTNGAWRDVPSGRRFVLPAGCAPRRSKRFMWDGEDFG